MTEIEAIKRLDRNAYRTTCYGNRVVEHEENLIAIQALEEVQKYREIGSMEECRAAREKQIAKNPMMAYDDKIDSNWVSCPICANGIGWEIPARKIKFCWDCGQRLDLGGDEK